MSQSTTTADPAPADDPGPAARRRPGGRMRSWTVLIATISLIYLADVLPPYLTLDPAQSRAEIRPDVPLHYPLLLLHITCGTIAFLTMCLQIWPWLRRAHPAVHRVSGTVYVFAGALPTAVLAVVLTSLEKGWAADFGTVAHASLWFTTSLVGYRMARRRRWIEHQRWMLYSVALLLGIIWGRGTVDFYTLTPFKFDVHYIFEIARWAGWMVNLIIVQIYVELRLQPKLRRRALTGSETR
ncbi:DUF2306 domain-containing protein [Amycolatopsis sp. NBC_01480]|uniref:DUF2306 domain-containing protein n=1 Tax=Amycolatopsis sp. NBC_01480 TaxID=2903562 RepID=UPI002E27E153|nr:DUF2306 domain-containing protein [Amycolatopsis sp. NBC_01480]